MKKSYIILRRKQKMKVKKLLALCMSVAVTATAATTVMPVMAETSTQTNSTVLFSDDFEAYTNNTNGDLPLYYGEGQSMKSTYKSDYFKYTHYAGVNTKQKSDTYNPFMTEGTLAKHIQFVDGKSVGSGKSMTVTSQGFIDYAGIIKQSNITADKIAEKALTFSIDFKVNRMYFGEGYGVYLANYDSSLDKIVPNQKEDANMDALRSVDTDKQLLVVAPERKDGKPQIFAFGQNIGEVETGKAYTYTLKLTPDGNGGYTAAAYIDSTALKNIAADKLPTVKEISSFEYVMMSPISHKWTIYDSQFGRKPTDDSGNKNYQNDIDIISVDNLMMTATVIDNSVLFSDGFDGYTGDKPYTPIGEDWGKKPTSYNDNYFRRNGWAYVVDISKTNESKIMVPGNLNEHINFAEYAGFGNGKVMTVISQGAVDGYGIIKASNITESNIADKKLVFSIDFKIDRMYYGEGYGIFMSSANASGELSPEQIENFWPGQTLASDDSLKKKQLLEMYPVSRVTLDANGHNTAAISAHAFGQKIADIYADRNYTYTLELIPDGTGGYKASAYFTENGSAGTKVNITANVPTVAEFATYTNVMMSPKVHKYTLYSNQFESPSAITNPPQYENGKKIISLDNIMMRTVDYANMEGATVKGYAAISGDDGRKTVTVKISPLSGKSITPYVIVAVYNPETGELKSARLWEGNGTSISTEKTATVAEIAATSTDKVSVFMWNGFTDIKPLTNSVIFN